MFLAKKLNRGAGTPAAPADAQFNYVTMLLHGDGTNGAQNNTFLDSSTNNFTITRNGNTTQGSFSPYGSNWSNFFDGTTDYLLTPNNAALGLGTGDFTSEMWLYPTNWNNTYVFPYATAATGSTGLMVGKFTTDFVVRGNNDSNQLTYGTLPALNTWTHIAVVRSGTTLSMYFNGTRVATATNSYSFGAAAVSLGSDGFGSDFAGYMSNVRLVKGTAVYDPTQSTLTVPTTPLTAISGTSLLTCQSNRFVDSSASPLTITVNGTPSVQRFNPFGTSTAYSTSVIGGSGYFDGSGDYLNATSASLSGQFTIEYWYYSTTSSTNYGVTFGDSSTSTGIELYQSGTTFYLYSNNGFRITGGTVNPNSWNHVALTRDGSNVMRLYVNGVVSGTTYTSSANFSTTMRLGAEFYSGSISGYLTGYVCDFRMLSATSTPTIPTSPLTAISGTTMLLNFTNGAIFDNAMMNDLETVGNAQISTSVVKFGTGSMYFDGTGDALYSTSQSVIFGTGDFTLEFWVYFNAVNNSTVKFIYDMRNSGATSASFLAQEAGNTWTYWNGAGTSISSGFTSSTFTSSTWTHVAICRSSGTTRFFAGGTLTNSAADTSNYANSTLTFGARYSISDALNGYIDDLRITKGFARYTATFTPPTSALSDTGPV
jgi:hypothetical protein